MKFNCGATPEQRAAAREEAAKQRVFKEREWHDVFAWIPTRVGPNDCRWLETIECRVLGYVGIEVDPAYVTRQSWDDIEDWYFGGVQYRPKQQRGDE
jgi:hypothetical protein